MKGNDLQKNTIHLKESITKKILHQITILALCLIFDIYTPAFATNANCNYNQDSTFESFDGKVEQSNPTYYTDSGGNTQKIIPNTFLLRLYFSRKWAEAIFDFSSSYRGCYASLYINKILIARKNLSVALMLDEWQKYIDQFFIIADKSIVSEETISSSIKKTPIKLNIKLEQEM